MKNLAKVVALAAFAMFSTGAQGKHSKHRTEYGGRDRCGLTVNMPPPMTHAWGDIDLDGDVEHFYANWSVIERHRLLYDDRPEKVSTVYESEVNEPYMCVDLRLRDLDKDGDLDMVYASPREVVEFENKEGKMEVKNWISYHFDSDKDIRIKFSRVNGRLVIELDENHKEK